MGNLCSRNQANDQVVEFETYQTPRPIVTPRRGGQPEEQGMPRRGMKLRLGYHKYFEGEQESTRQRDQGVLAHGHFSRRSIISSGRSDCENQTVCNNVWDHDTTSIMINSQLLLEVDQAQECGMILQNFSPRQIIYEDDYEDDISLLKEMEFLLNAS